MGDVTRADLIEEGRREDAVYVEHMERIEDYLDGLRKEILEACKRKLKGGGIDPTSYKPESYMAARAIVSVVMIEKGRNMYNQLSGKPRKDARNLMFF